MPKKSDEQRLADLRAQQDEKRREEARLRQEQAVLRAQEKVLLDQLQGREEAALGKRAAQAGLLAYKACDQTAIFRLGQLALQAELHRFADALLLEAWTWLEYVLSHEQRWREVRGVLDSQDAANEEE